MELEKETDVELKQRLKHEENGESKASPKDDSETWDTVLVHVGEMGKYQKILVAAMLPYGIFWAFAYFSQMFITATPQVHWCHVPDLAHLSPELRRNLSVPGAAKGYELDQCRVFIANWSQILETLVPPDPGTPTTGCTNGWDFELEDIPYSTVVSERGWVCENDWYVPFTQAVAFAGSVVGCLVFGRLSDIYDRLTILICACLVGCTGSIFTVTTSYVWDFAICRFMVGMSCDSCFTLIYILVSEYVGNKHRTWVSNLSIALFFGGGCLMLPWIAVWCSDWRRFILVFSLPMVLAIALTPFVVPKSVRWLVSRGRVDEANKILKKFERINKTTIPPDVLDEFMATSNISKNEDKSAFVLFKYSSLRTMTIYLIILFMACALVFDAVIRVTENLGMNFFIAFTMTSSTELPATILLIWLLDRWGRRWLSGGTMFIAGVFSIIGAFVPRGIAAGILATAACLFINMSYNIAIQWAAEILPTPVRASGQLYLLLTGYIADMASPYVIYSKRAWYALPLIVVGLASIVGGGASLLLPETLGRSLPQTMRDGERLAMTRWCGGNGTDDEEQVNDSENIRMKNLQ